MTPDDIYQLLKENSRVIVPDLGAFMVKSSDSSVFFNEFLKFNDGLLLEYLSKKKNIDRPSAIKEISDFTELVHQSLDRFKIFDLGALGILELDYNEKIQLQKPVNSKDDYDQLEDLQNNDLKIETQIQEIPYTKPTINQKITESLDPMYNLEVSQEAEYPEDNNRSEYITNKEIRRKKVFVFFTVTLLTVIIVLYLAFFRNASFIEQIQQTKTNNHLPAAKAVPQSVQPAKPVNSAVKNPGTPVAVDTPKVNIPSERPAELKPNAEQSQPVAEQKILKEPEKEVTDPAPKVKTVSENDKAAGGGKKYHIIAGVFTIEKNAEQLVRKLKEQGYDASIVRKQGQSCYVSYASFAGSEEAQAKLKGIQSAGLTGWIMKY